MAGSGCGRDAAVEELHAQVFTADAENVCSIRLHSKVSNEYSRDLFLSFYSATQVVVRFILHSLRLSF